MRALALFVLFTPALAAAPVPKAKKADDLTLLEGRWEGVSVDTGGGPARDSTDYWFEVKDGKLSTGIGNSPGYVARTLRIDSDASPKRIDVDDTRGGFHLGIFEIDGDTVRWCESSSTTKRPAELKAVDGFNLLVYKRVKKE